MMATSHRFSWSAARLSEVASSLMSCATTSSPGRGAAMSTSRTTKPSSVVECSMALRRAAVNVASPHWVGGNVLTKPYRVLMVQGPSDRSAPKEPKSEPLDARAHGQRACTASGCEPPAVPYADQKRGLYPRSNHRHSQAHQVRDLTRLPVDHPAGDIRWGERDSRDGGLAIEAPREPGTSRLPAGTPAPHEPRRARGGRAAPAGTARPRSDRRCPHRGCVR